MEDDSLDREAGADFDISPEAPTGVDVPRALNEAMTAYETLFGEIRRPGALEEDEPNSFDDEA
jgi:hypothetical protein